jgi:hypothetical protein
MELFINYYDRKYYEAYPKRHYMNIRFFYFLKGSEIKEFSQISNETAN